MEVLHIILDALRHSILITGLVVVMMMMIESLNIESRGMLFSGLRRTKLGQVIVSALLGSIPGCMGGFAVVSLYTHRLVSFGALVAMMIASSGEEAFMMLALVPKEAMILFALLFVLAVATGYIIDLVHSRMKHKHDFAGGIKGDVGYVIHPDDEEEDEEDPDHRHEEMHVHEHEHTHDPHKKQITWGWKRIVLLCGLALFILALLVGVTGHEHADPSHHHALNSMLNEDWMHILFGLMSIVLLIVLCFSSDHFINGHIWHHVIRKHLPSIFGWTFGVLLFLGVGMHFIDITKWISDNVVLMILLATLVGLIPESGPHMIFVTLYASGIVPFSVLLASSISQDGHASLPLLAESKKGYLNAKLINCVVAILAGLLTMNLTI